MIIGLLALIFRLFFLLAAVVLIVQLLSDIFVVLAAVLWIAGIFLTSNELDKLMRKKWGILLSQNELLPPIPAMILMSLEAAFGFIMIFAAILSQEMRFLMYIAISLVVCVVPSVLLMNRKYRKAKSREGKTE